MAAPVPRSPVASDVFTLMWGDCYFCAEPDNSIIHHGCWCTHFTSVRMEAGVSSFECVPLALVYARFGACARVCEDLQQKMNCWHATPHSRRGKRQEEKRKRSCHKHGNQRDMKREVRIKEQKEKRQGISSLIFSLSKPRTFQSSTAQSTVTKKKRFFELPAKLKLSYRGAQPFQHKRLFFFFFFYPPRVLLLSSCTHEIKHNISAFY